MPFERINLHLSNCDWNVAVCKTVDVLQSGGVAVVPTETVYGLAVRLNDRRAVQKLIELKGRNENHPFALAFSRADAIEDICPDMSPLACRLARRCLPGPVSLVIDLPSESIFWKLPTEIQKAVSLQSSICCRVPDHPLLLTVLGEMNEPIVLTSANKSGQGEMANVDQLIAELGHGIDLLIDNGSLASPKPSTIVKVAGNDYTVLREGVIKAETVKRLSALMILFVCTGNLCRSPMAEYLCEKMLAERLHCPVDALEQRGIVILSAGVSDFAATGQPATDNAIEVMLAEGIDMSRHRSSKINETHVRFADFIFTMTRSHRERILSMWHNADSRLSVLRTDGGDIADPMGHSIDVYQSCAEQIRRELDRRLEEMVLR
ncbi:MAG: threonylcarbamoyl-AMP synthase [Planctomycetaceae bacterium]|jgi:protein-tyrosine phosphatase|nr:threonylcarbamoyl-AMP synthase [Planctomycetaceae bacterium]